MPNPFLKKISFLPTLKNWWYDGKKKGGMMFSAEYHTLATKFSRSEKVATAQSVLCPFAAPVCNCAAWGASPLNKMSVSPE